MFKNVASQKIPVYAYDSTTGTPKTGDAANLTAYVSKDYGAVTVLGDTSATEMDATNAKGWYLFDLTQAETNADACLFTGKSSTSNIFIVGQLIYTDPPNYTSASIDSNGRVDVIKIAGTTQTARDIGASVITASGTVTTVSGNVNGSVGSVTGAVGSVTGAVGSVTGLTASNLDATVSSRLATAGYTAPDNASITGIKSKTDSLTFTVANKVDSNIKSVNNVTVTGNGAGTPWGP